MVALEKKITFPLPQQMRSLEPPVCGVASHLSGFPPDSSAFRPLTLGLRSVNHKYFGRHLVKAAMFCETNFKQNISMFSWPLVMTLSPWLKSPKWWYRVLTCDLPEPAFPITNTECRTCSSSSSCTTFKTKLSSGCRRSSTTACLII